VAFASGAIGTVGECNVAGCIGVNARSDYGTALNAEGAGSSVVIATNQGNGTAVAASSSGGTAVAATSSNGAAITASSNGNATFIATNGNNIAVDASTTNGVALKGTAPLPNGTALKVDGKADLSAAFIDVRARVVLATGVGSQAAYCTTDGLPASTPIGIPIGGGCQPGPGGTATGEHGFVLPNSATYASQGALGTFLGGGYSCAFATQGHSEATQVLCLVTKSQGGN
jgi:hypothetical protein